MTKFVRRINKTATENVKLLDRLRIGKQNKTKKTQTLWGWHPPFPLAPKVEYVTVNYVLSHYFVFLTWFGVFRSVAVWSQWFQSFFSSYMQTISHLTNSYTLPCYLRLIPQFYFSIFHKREWAKRANPCASSLACSADVFWVGETLFVFVILL